VVLIGGKMLNKFLSHMVLVSASVLSVGADAHEDDERVAIELEGSHTLNSGQSKLSFQLIDTEQRKVLTPSDLNVMHEKALHLFVFDLALAEYSHLHPEFKNGVWETPLELKTNGTYLVWAQGEISVGAAKFKSDVEIKVIGGLPANPSPPALVDVRRGTDRISQLTISNDKLRAGQMIMPTMTFARADGSRPDITPYLGALAHVVIVSQDDKKLLHVHPMSTANPNQLMLHITFETAGLYRVWAQFLDAGVLKTVALALKVNP